MFPIIIGILANISTAISLADRTRNQQEAERLYKWQTRKAMEYQTVEYQTVDSSTLGRILTEATYCYAEPQDPIIIALLDHFFQIRPIVGFTISHNYHDFGSTGAPTRSW